MSFRRVASNPRDAAWTASRAQALRQVALARQLSRRAVRRARIELLVLLPALAGIFVL
jgi:hypothetical protein